MNKILVEVYIPAANKSYDVFLPTKYRIYEVLQLLLVNMKDLVGGYFEPSEDTVICNGETGKVLDINKSVEEHSLTNGSKLIII